MMFRIENYSNSKMLGIKMSWYNGCGLDISIGIWFCTFNFYFGKENIAGKVKK